MPGKQAKILSPAQQRAVMAYLSEGPTALRDTVMFLLSCRAGLRAKEISGLTWAMCTDSAGRLASEIALPDRASKGKNGGRTVPLHPQLRKALADLMQDRADKAKPKAKVIYSTRADLEDSYMSPNVIAQKFLKWYQALGFVGCSSHSGRRTFITSCARNVTRAGGSLRDVQDLAGHSNLSTTQRYIDLNPKAKRKVVNML